ncbi:MAG: formate dehydrogenase accessory sulfurtransferase FdhD [Bacteroidota bacterium]
MMTSTTQHTILQISTSGSHTLPDQLAVEEPLSIKIAYGTAGQPQDLSVTMRTPGHDKELAVGFLFTEGIIRSFDDADNLYKSGENEVVVVLKPQVQPDPEKLMRNFYMTSSCGVCGKASIDAVRIQVDPIQAADFSVLASAIYTMPDQLLKAQSLFESTGGLHASALFNGQGELEIIREDVGRHNALDKAIGAMLAKKKMPLSSFVLLVSGRSSFELVQKAALAGIPVVAAVGAPSSLAVQLAHDVGITLIGFLRYQKFNVYTHLHRIKT